MRARRFRPAWSISMPTDAGGRAEGFLDGSLKAIATGHPDDRLDELLPWNLENLSSRIAGVALASLTMRQSRKTIGTRTELSALTAQPKEESGRKPQPERSNAAGYAVKCRQNPGQVPPDSRSRVAKICRSGPTPGSSSCRPTSSHSAYRFSFVTVEYRWHPFHGRRLHVRSAKRRDGIVLLVEGDSHIFRKLPRWMCDPAVCRTMTVGPPLLRADALRELPGRRRSPARSSPARPARGG